jgi:hypothetical protein
MMLDENVEPHWAREGRRGGADRPRTLCWDKLDCRTVPQAQAVIKRGVS